MKKTVEKASKSFLIGLNPESRELVGKLFTGLCNSFKCFNYNNDPHNWRVTFNFSNQKEYDDFQVFCADRGFSKNTKENWFIPNSQQELLDYSLTLTFVGLWRVIGFPKEQKYLTTFTQIMAQLSEKDICARAM